LENKKTAVLKFGCCFNVEKSTYYNWKDVWLHND
jgi:hypothetical protein